MPPTPPADQSAVSELIEYGRHRYFSEQGYDLPQLLAMAPGVVLEAAGEIWGVALATPPHAASAWLIGLALVDRVGVAAALAHMLPPLIEQLRHHGVAHLFYAGSIAMHNWPLVPLQHSGFVHATDVLVYEKRRFTIPAAGDPAALVRNVQAADIPALLELDHACFEPQWRKSPFVMQVALLQPGSFQVLEYGGQFAGYALLSSHYDGRLQHLVRIAVAPALRGRGLGVRLLAEAVAYAQRQHANVLTLNTQAYNTAARRLYEWFGFRLTGDKQIILRRDLYSEVQRY